MIHGPPHGGRGFPLSPRRQTRENEAEFFAVATECFYEQPRELQQEHPDLYAILRDFYHVEPAEWAFRQ